MALEFTGKSGSSEDFELLLEAHYGYVRIEVVTSEEAIEDFGLDAVHQRASEKYDAGEFDPYGRISVLTDDF